MNAALLLVVGCVILIVGYVTYGKWLAEQWGIDENRVTPAHELEDGNDYVPAKAPVLMGVQLIQRQAAPGCKLEVFLESVGKDDFKHPSVPHSWRP